ncbi:ATP-binding protein [Neosynechococcus sphagnicola]|uniref:sensor histidine kinase n=1 Tax=Neosynechococcus sphagnicola TaxID=1501145 RepID=UPI00068D8500|nr:ATP-binding protein [Neosynechococcus sphagnicola]
MAEISPQILAVFQRALSLRERAQESPVRNDLLDAALKELYDVLEELQVAEEDLYHRNQELTNAFQEVISQRQRYQDLFDLTPHGYVVTDAQGKILEANRAIATLLASPRAFLIDKPLSIFIAPDDRQAFSLQLGQLQNLKRIEAWEIQICPVQQSPLPAVLTVETTRDPSGSITCLRWLIQDGRERQQFKKLLVEQNTQLEQQALQRTEELQRALEFETGLKRITDKVRDSLDEAEILQIVVEEIATRLKLDDCSAFLLDLDAETATLRYQFAAAQDHIYSLGDIVEIANNRELYTQISQGYSFQFCTWSGEQGQSQRTILFSSIFDDQGTLGYLQLTQLYSRVFNHQEIRLVQQVASQCAIALRQARFVHTIQQQIRQLEILNHLKDDFLSTVSHELRSPLTSIKLSIRMLEIALKQSGVLTTEPHPINNYFEILKTECDREILLVNNLLDMARLEAEKAQLFLTTVELQTWVPTIAKGFRERCQLQQQQLCIEIPPDLPPLTTDVTELEQILRELLHNACKYTPAHGRISVTAQSTAGSIALIVSNTGVEIPLSERDRIFERFYRIPHSDPWKHGGTGLGLALVRKRVEYIGATIEVQGQPGQTSFQISFPPYPPYGDPVSPQTESDLA